MSKPIKQLALNVVIPPLNCDHMNGDWRQSAERQLALAGCVISKMYLGDLRMVSGARRPCTVGYLLTGCLPLVLQGKYRGKKENQGNSFGRINHPLTCIQLWLYYLHLFPLSCHEHIDCRHPPTTQNTHAMPLKHKNLWWFFGLSKNIRLRY